MRALLFLIPSIAFAQAVPPSSGSGGGVHADTSNTWTAIQTFTQPIVAADAGFNSIKLTGDLNGQDAGFNNVSANNVTLTGDLNGQDAGFNNVSANNVTLIGGLNGQDAGFNAVTLTGGLSGQDAGFNAVTLTGGLNAQDAGFNNISANAGTFSGAVSASNLSNTNSGDVALGSANGLSIAGQVLSMSLAGSSASGTVSTAAQTFAGTKTFSSAPSMTLGVLYPGVATGSLAACSGSSTTGVQYDSTLNVLKVCDGTAWRTLGELAIANTWSGVQTFSAAVTLTNSTTALDFSGIGADGNIKQTAGNDLIFNFGSTEFFRIKHGGGLDINTNGATVNIYGGGSLNNSSSGQPVTVSDAQGLALVGVANASLPACNSTAPPTGTRGTLQYDTTNNVMVFCNGSVWKTITTN